MITRWARELSESGSKAFGGQGKARDEEMAVLKREAGSGQRGTAFRSEVPPRYARRTKEVDDISPSSACSGARSISRSSRLLKNVFGPEELLTD